MELRPDLLLDRRLIERHIARGLISRADYEKHLAALADKVEVAQAMNVELTAVGVSKVESTQDEELKE